MNLPLPPLLTLAAFAAVDPAANRAARRAATRRSQTTTVHADPATELRPAITIQRASKLYDIAYSTLRQWIREGKLPAWKVAGGRQVRVFVADLEALFVRVGGDD